MNELTPETTELVIPLTKNREIRIQAIRMTPSSNWMCQIPDETMSDIQDNLINLKQDLQELEDE